MIKINISNNELTLNIEGWDALWSFRGSVKLQLRNIVDIKRLTGAPWLKSPGTSLPRIITAGTYCMILRGQRSFGARDIMALSCQFNCKIQNTANWF